MLTALLEPTEGRSCTAAATSGRMSSRSDTVLGYVPEEPNLYGYLTGLAYLQLAGGLRGLSTDVVNSKANELLEPLYAAPDS